MVTPKIPKPIKVLVTSGVEGQPVTVRNRTNGDEQRITLGAKGGAVDLQNFANGYTAGDVIDFMVAGSRVGATSLTTSGDKPQTVTVSTAAIQTTVSRGM